MSDCGSAHKSSETPFELAMPILNVRLRVGYKDKQKKRKTKRPRKTTVKHVVASDVDTDDLSKDEDNDDESSESVSSPPPKKTSKKSPVEVEKTGCCVEEASTEDAAGLLYGSRKQPHLVRIKGEPSRLLTYGHDGNNGACKKKALAYIRNFFVERGFPLPPIFPS